MWLNDVAGDLGSEQQTLDGTWNAKLLQSQFAHGIDDDHATATFAQVHERGQQSGMIAGRIAPDNHGAVGHLEIVQCHCGRAGTQGGIQSDPAGLMTVVAAIVQVVGAVEPDH